MLHTATKRPGWAARLSVAVQIAYARAFYGTELMADRTHRDLTREIEQAKRQHRKTAHLRARQQARIHNALEALRGAR